MGSDSLRFLLELQHCLFFVVVVQSPNCVWLSATPWTTVSDFPVLHYIPGFAQTHVHCPVMLSNHLTLCHPLLLLPQSSQASGSFPVSWLFESVQFSRSVVSNSLWPHGLQHARLPCPSPAPRACSNSCPLSQWCHPTISSSVGPFSSCPQSLPASGSFPLSQFFALADQSIGVSASASVLPMNV